MKSTASRWFRRLAWTFLMGGAALLALLALGFYVWSESIEAAWQRHMRTGRAMVASLSQLEHAFSSGDERGLEGFFHSTFTGPGAGWTKGKAAQRWGLTLEPWIPAQDAAARAGWVRAFKAWRHHRPWLQEVNFKLQTIPTEPADDTCVTGIFRFEVVGRDPRGNVFTDRGRMRAVFQKAAPLWQVTQLTLLTGESVTGGATFFQECAQTRGLVFTLLPDPRLAPGGIIPLRYQVLRHAYAGASTGDFDADGFDDVLLLSGQELALFRNQGDGTFADVTRPSGLGAIHFVNTALFVDFDNNGAPDLYLSRYFGRPLLMRNNGDGTFTQMTTGSGLGSDEFVSCMSSADFDNNGFPDLYLGKFLDGRTRIPDTYLYARNGPPNTLYLNLGNHTFQDFSARSHSDDLGLTASVSAGDYDRDGKVDIWCVNDYGRNVLYRGNGDGSFLDVTQKSGTQWNNGGMSAMFADYDNDGWLDFYISSIGSNQLWSSQRITPRRFVAKSLRDRLAGRGSRPSTVFGDLLSHFGTKWDQVGEMSLAGNTLWHNNGDGTFANVSDKAGVRPPGWFWSSGFFDVDNDGFKDILASNGWITGKNNLELDFASATNSGRPYDQGYAFSDQFLGSSSWNGNERDAMLMNRGDGTFQEAGAAMGIDSVTDGRGIAASDFDHDGDVDFVLNSYNAPAQYFLNTRGQDHAWLEVELVGTTSNRQGIGAQVFLRDGRHQTVVNVAAGEGYSCQYTLVAHFGLGDVKKVDEIEVLWPGRAQRQKLGPVKACQRIRVVEK